MSLVPILRRLVFSMTVCLTTLNFVTSPKAFAADAQSVKLTVRVIDKNTQKPIPNARIDLVRNGRVEMAAINPD